MSYVKVHVYDKGDPTKLLGILPGYKEVMYSEALNTPSGGSVTVSLTDPHVIDNPGILNYRNLVAVYRDDKLVGSFVIQKKKTNPVAKDASSEEVILSGEGILTWLKDAVVYPERGLKTTSYTSRHFNFSSLPGAWYDETAWKAPVNTAAYGKFPWGPPWVKNPPDFPNVKNLRWIWSEQTTGSGSAIKHPKGDNYIRITFNAPVTGEYSMFYATDGRYWLYVDGQYITASQGNAHKQTTRHDMRLEKGDHIIAFRIHNTSGPAGLLASMYRGGADDPKDNKLVWATGRNPSAMKVLGYPDEQPGFTAGEIMLTLMDEAEERGVATTPHFKPTFTATHDSMGNPWRKALEWSFGVGDDLFSVLESLTEVGVDVWVDPTDFSLHMAPDVGVDRSAFQFEETGKIVHKNIFGNPRGAQISSKGGLLRNATISNATRSYEAVTSADGYTVSRNAAVYTRSKADEPSMGGFEARWGKPGVRVNVGFRFTSDKAQTVKVYALPEGISDQTIRQQVSSFEAVPGTNWHQFNFLSPSPKPSAAWEPYIGVEIPSGPAGEQFAIGDIVVMLGNTAVIEEPWSGSSSSGPTVTYRWEGQVDGSASIREAGTPSSGALKFERGKNLFRADIDGVGDLKNTLLVRTEDSWFEEEGPAYEGIGRIEAKLSTSLNVTGSREVVDAIFKRKSIPEESAAYDILTENGHLPWEDFGVGDWVLAPDDRGLMVKRRVVSISMDVNDAGVPVYALEFDSLYKTTEDKLKEYIERQGGSLGLGSSNSGSMNDSVMGKPTTSNPPTVYLTYPEAPATLDVIANEAYWDVQGISTFSMVTLQWAEVLLNTDGSETVPESYQLEMRDVTEEEGWVPVTITSATTATITGLQSAGEYEFRVRAQNSPSQPGDYSPIVSVTTVTANSPMPAPSAPTLSTERGLLIMGWDGLLGGAEPPPQFRSMFALVSTDGGTTYRRMGSSFLQDTRTVTLAGVPVGTEVMVKYVALDGIGLPTEESSASAITIEGIDLGSLDEDVADAIDAAKGAADAAAALAQGIKDTDIPNLEGELDDAQQAVADANARLATAETELEAVGTEVGNLSGTVGGFDSRIQEAENAVIAAEGRLELAEQELANLENTLLPGLTSRLDDAESDLAAADGRLSAAEGDLTDLDAALGGLSGRVGSVEQELDDLVIPSIDGLNKITYSAGVPMSTAGYSDGDTWFRRTSAGLITGQWEFSGSQWLSRTVDNQMIANLDAGKINAGTISTDRLAARSITSDKLLVGSFDNLIADVIRDTGTIEPHTAATNGTLVKQATTADANGVDPGDHLFGTRIGGTADSMANVFYLHGTDGELYIPVEPNTRYRLSALMRRGGNYPNGAGSIRFAVNQRTAANTSITYVGYTYHAPLWTWDEFSDEFETAPDAAFVRIDVQMNAIEAAYRVALPKLMRMGAGELIVDGAITGRKIEAGSITAADAVFADAAIVNADIANLNASKLNAGTIAAARIGADSIDATKISSYNLTTSNATIGNAVVKDAAIESVNAVKINAGELDAARIGARSITAEKLLIGTATNVIPGADDIAANSGGFPAVNGWGINTTHPSVWVQGRRNVESLPFTLRAGDRVRISADVQASSEGTRFYMGIAPAGVFSTSSGAIWGGASNALIPTAFSEFSGEVVVPETRSDWTFTVLAQYTTGSQNPTGYTWFRNPRVANMVGATIIENGAITTEKVAADAITGNKIKAGSVTAADGIFENAAIVNADIANLNASKLNAGTVHANRIGANSITANKLAANSVTAEKVMIGSVTNMLPNGIGEKREAIGWASGLTFDGTKQPDGIPGMFKSAKGQGTYSVSTHQAPFDVVPGGEYLMEVWLQADTPDSLIYFEIRDENSAHLGTVTKLPPVGYNDDGSPIEVPDGISGAYPVGGYKVPTSVVKLSALFTIPEGVTKAALGSIYFNHPNGTNKNAQVWTAVRIRPRAGGALLVDGTVTAAAIQAEAIAAEHIQADAVTARQLQAESVAAEHIAAGAIETNHLSAGSVTVDKLQANLGQELDIGSNTAISLIVQNTDAMQQGLDENSEWIQDAGMFYRFDTEAAWIETPDSPYFLRLSNDRISINVGSRENPEEISRWTTDGMYAQKFEGDEVRLAFHQIMTYDNNSTVFRWVG